MAWSSIAYHLILSYWTVLLAELIGDKSIYTVTSLTLRFRPGVVYCGITAAFMGKMLGAVLFGRALGHLPLVWTSMISAITFLGSAACIWLKKEAHGRPTPHPPPSWQSAVAVSFFAIFCSEWADLGQISAAALVVRYNAPGPIWLGGSLALCTKGALAITLGLSLRKKVPERFLRTLSTSSCLVLALLSLYDLILPRP